MKRSWYSAEIAAFQLTSDESILGELVKGSSFPVLPTQTDAWLQEMRIFRSALANLNGWLHLEFEIPRMGRRIDAVVLVNGIVLSIEFKIGADQYLSSDIDQTYDYALDLKYFHEATHDLIVVPVLVASKAPARTIELTKHPRIPDLYKPVCTNAADLPELLNHIVGQLPAKSFDPREWANAPYCPTPTIIEAARALYAGHGVAEISRNDAGAINLTQTSEQLFQIIDRTKSNGEKAICFVTGVPGAGKTLVGLNIATRYSDQESELYSVFLSGNKPLVDILREALGLATEKWTHQEAIAIDCCL